MGMKDELRKWSNDTFVILKIKQKLEIINQKLLKLNAYDLLKNRCLWNIWRKEWKIKRNNKKWFTENCYQIFVSVSFKVQIDFNFILCQ